MTFTGKLAAATALALCSTSATAAEFLFDFKGVDTSKDASFTLDSEPDPSSAGNGRFTFKKVEVTTPKSTSKQTINFYTSQYGGGFNFNNSGKFDAYGPQLFSGTIADPTFHTGVYTMTKSFNGVVLGTLTVSAMSAVPEPATWAMILLGFAFTGSMMRKGRKQQKDARFRPHTHGNVTYS